MNAYALFPLIVGTWIAIIGTFVLLKDKKSFLNRVFSLICYSCVVWLYGYVIVYSASSEEVALIFSRVVYTGVIFIPVFFYHFTIEFLHWCIQKPKNKTEILAVYVLGIIFLIFLFTTDLFVAGVYKYFWGYYIKGGIIHSLFLIFFPTVWMGGVFRLYLSYKKIAKKLPLQGNTIKYLFFGFLVGSPGMLDFIQNYGVQFYPVGAFFVAIGWTTVAYTLVRYNVLNINIIFTRAGVFASVYILVLGIPFAIGTAVIKRGGGWWILPVTVMAILASLGPFIYTKIRRKLEERIRKEEFKAQRQLRRLSHDMIRFSKLDDLLKLIVHYLLKIYKLKFAGIYLINNGSGKYALKSFWQLGAETNLPNEYDANSHLVQEITSSRVALVTEELKLYKQKTFSPYQRELLNDLTNLKISTIIPSFIRNELLGFLVLSDRRSNMTFSQEDLNLLMVLSNEAALAIENAQFHQKERSVLAEKSRREALADMAPGASHQFNNRLAAISSSAELLLMKIEDMKPEELSKEKIASFLNDAKNTLELIDQEVFKGKEITSAILKRAKAKVEVQEVNVKTILENAHKLVLISKGRSGVERFKSPKFKFDSLTDIPNTMGSEALLQDCFYNLFDNAFDAMNEKTTLIVQGELMDQASTNYQGEIEAVLEAKDGYIIIKIKDNGIGLKPENARKLFAPYFTTKATSGKGTGLGLYVIRDFIEMHNGTITCESQYGAGTIFTIRLPIKPSK